jgi:hypothetical protein
MTAAPLSLVDEYEKVLPLRIVERRDCTAMRLWIRLESGTVKNPCESPIDQEFMNIARDNTTIPRLK